MFWRQCCALHFVIVFGLVSLLPESAASLAPYCCAGDEISCVISHDGLQAVNYNNCLYGRIDGQSKTVDPSQRTKERDWESYSTGTSYQPELLLSVPTGWSVVQGITEDFSWVLEFYTFGLLFASVAGGSVFTKTSRSYRGEFAFFGGYETDKVDGAWQYGALHARGEVMISKCSLDCEAPVIAGCPSFDLTVPADVDQTHSSQAGFSITASDNMDGTVPVTETHDYAPTSLFPLGTTALSFQAVDQAGNGPVFCDFNVIVVEPEMYRVCDDDTDCIPELPVCGMDNDLCGACDVAGASQCYLHAGTTCALIGAYIGKCVFPCGASPGYYCPFGVENATPLPCPVGHYCAGDISGAVPCTSVPEGYYCPEGVEREDQGLPCEAGYYCAGNTIEAPAVRRECAADEGFYCPAVFTPISDAAISVHRSGTEGRRCPPNKYCAGNQTQPVDFPAVCDLVQSCGPPLWQNATCEALQSTFYSLSIPTDYATDQDHRTCMKTADAVNDDNAQWVRVDLGSPRVIGTVRFVSDAAGDASNFSVIATMMDAAAPPDLPDPSAGGAIPTPYDTCGEASALREGVFEAACPPGTIGQFVFVRRAEAKEILEVCDVEVFGHACEAAADALPSCPKGSEPSRCMGADAYCRGCASCPPGTYSDKEESPDPCTPCPGVGPYGEQPYAPEGSTSVFQCEATQHLDSASTLGVAAVKFNQSIDAWVIDVDFELGEKVQVIGVAAFYLSSGGDGLASEDNTFQASNFPCKAAGGGGYAETTCCLQSFRERYATTKIFRDYTDGLDLVAANDVCDGPQGSTMLLNAGLDVVGSNGTVFVDSAGAPFANPITVELTNTSMADSYYKGTYSARITIPDSELYKVSKRKGTEGSLADTRELFIGLLDMLPTGTSVVDSSSQQISVVLTRTQYGSFAAYGAQNIDYDFISYLNARVYQVKNRDALNARQLEYLDWQWHDTVQAERCSFDPIKGVQVADQCERVNTRGSNWDSVCHCVGGTGTCGNTGCKTEPLRYPGWDGNYAGARGAAGRELFLESKTAAYFAEISFVWDANLEPAVEGAPVDVNSVTVNGKDDSIWATYLDQWSGISPLQPCTIGVQGAWAAIAAAAGITDEALLADFLANYAAFDEFPFDATKLPDFLGSSDFREKVHDVVFDYNAFFLPLVNQQCGPSVFPADVMGEFDFRCLAPDPADGPKSDANKADECFVPTPDGYTRLLGLDAEVELDPAPGGDSIYTSPPVMEGFCPQQARAQDNFGLLYVPLRYAPQIYGDEIEVSFDLVLKDSAGLNASLKVEMVLKADDFATMCDDAEASVDLAELVIPALQIGSEATAPPRLERIAASATPTDFGTGAETLQDGLITLELALNTTDGLADNLEVFLEDVLVIHVNPGSLVTAEDMRTDDKYKPTYTYTPSSRDAELTIPPMLEGACTVGDAPSTAFGCVYKHVLKDKVIQNDAWAYLVGSGDAQAFMETMLGAGTARASARALGRAYEDALLADGFGTRTKVGLWINPGHLWGETGQNSDYSLSEHVIIYALYGVNSGVSGDRRRMLLQASGGRQDLVQSVTYEVKAEDLVEKLLPDTTASSWTLTKEVDPREACLEPRVLMEIEGQRLQDQLTPFASKVRDVQVLSLTVFNAECEEARRAGSAPLVMMEAVVALEDIPGAFIDFDALVAADDSVRAMQQIESGAKIVPSKATPEGTEKATGGDESGSSLLLTVGAGVGGAVVMLAGCAAYNMHKRIRNGGSEQLTDISTAGVLETGPPATGGKGAVEGVRRRSFGSTRPRIHSDDTEPDDGITLDMLRATGPLGDQRERD